MSNNQLQLELLKRAGPTAELTSYTNVKWASSMFEGLRHQFCFLFKSAYHAAKFTDEITDGKVDVNLIGSKLCELKVVETHPIHTHVAVTIEALTLKDI